ncbi:MAG: hypothetical protein Q8Q74_12425, partial [Polaromonas sp.]|nr:hypothetical protein [Polaromonas sp.]
MAKMSDPLTNDLFPQALLTVTLQGPGDLGACRARGVESENRPQRGQFLPDLQAHTPAMGQKDGEKWAAAVDLQPTLPKPDSLLEVFGSQHQRMVRRVADARHDVVGRTGVNHLGVER